MATVVLGVASGPALAAPRRTEPSTADPSPTAPTTTDAPPPTDPGLDPAIVGGTLAADGDFPWIAALTRNANSPFQTLACGGSVVARRWVVTAAHCITDVAPFNPVDYQVIIGLTRLPTTADADHTYGVATYEMDSRYNSQTRMHDLAVLELTRDVPVAPVTVPHPADAAAWAGGQSSTAAGWGTTSEGGSTSRDLRKVTMPVVSDNSCAASYGLVAAQTALMLCAGLPQGGVDTCQGDSGGPLLVTGPSGPLLAGATSFGQGCARPGFPGVYTEVAAERDFLEAAIAPDTPTLLSAAPAGAGAVSVSFAPGPADHGVDTTGYTVVASPGGATTTVPAGATSATVTGLAGGANYTFTVQALSAIGASPMSNPATVTTTNAAGTYHGVAPERLVDTRQTVPIAAGTSLTVPVTGRAGLPADGVAAVTLNVTATGATDAGYLTAYPCGTAPPLASNVNYAPGQTVANAATVAVGAGGAVCIFSLATADTVVDVTGWYASETGPLGARFAPVVPARLLDTRSAAAKVAPGATVAVPVLGRGGLPATGVTAATLNVTALDADAAGYLTAFPCGTDPPLASTVNYDAGAIVPNATTVALGVAGSVCVFSMAAAHIVLDGTGYFTDDPATAGSRLGPMAPLRVMDTRSGTNGTRLAGGAVLDLPVGPLLDQATGQHADRRAVVLNVTAAGASQPGYVTVFPCGGPPPLASNLNYRPGEVVPGQATVGLGPGADVCFTSLADVDLIVDVTGTYGP